MRERNQINSMLKAHDLSYAPRYGVLPVIQSCSYEFKPGQPYLLKGKNGSGKTTLLKLLAGIYAPDQGSILWQGRSIQEELASYQAQVIWIGHDLGLSHHLTVQETVTELLNLFQPFNPDAVYSALEHMSLMSSLKLKVADCSAGQKRRLSLLRLWLCNRPLWFLDEPSINLDSEVTQLVEEKIAELALQSIVVMSSHQALDSCSAIQLHETLWRGTGS